MDRVIEMAAAAVDDRREGANAERVGAAEARVRRLVGATSFLPAVDVMAQSVRALWTHDTQSKSTVGIVLAALSLSVMPLIAFGKFKVTDAVGSHALHAVAKETLTFIPIILPDTGISCQRYAWLVVG